MFGKFVIGLGLTVALLVPALAMPEDKKGEKKPEVKKDAAKKAVVKCPVTGEEIKDPAKAPSSEYQGKKVCFCCEKCKPKFDKDPSKYVKAEKKDEKKADKKEEKKAEKK